MMKYGHSRIALLSFCGFALYLAGCDFTDPDRRRDGSDSSGTGEEISQLSPIRYSLGVDVRSAAIDGNRILVGTKTGTALVYEYDGANWIKTAELAPSDDVRNFGVSVGLEGDRAIVGVVDVNAEGAYVFDWNGAKWKETKLLLPENITQPTLEARGARFGFGVAIDGRRAVVSAPGGNDACGNYYTGAETGSVYVFEERDSDWLQIEKITQKAESAGDRFGYTFTLDGDDLLIRMLHDANCLGSYLAGLIYYYQWDGSSWVAQQIIRVPPHTRAGISHFGAAIDQAEDRAIITLRGILYEGGYAKGKGYVYKKEGGLWLRAGTVTSAGPTSDRSLYHVNGAALSRQYAYISGSNNTGPDSIFVFEEDVQREQWNIKAAFSFHRAGAWDRPMAADGNRLVLGGEDAYIYEFHR